MDVRFVDCRYDLADPPAARRRYLEGHIPGAAFLDLDEDLSDLSIPPDVGGRHPLPGAERFAASAGRAGIGSDTLVVAYDEGMTGGAARLWWLLRHFGHDRAAVLDGGLGAWLGPLASGEETIEPAVFEPRERTDDVATTEEILERLGDGRLTLLDARPAERFRGETLGLDPVAGHIPGARQPASRRIRARARRSPRGRGDRGLLRLGCRRLCAAARLAPGGPARRTPLPRLVERVVEERPPRGDGMSEQDTDPPDPVIEHLRRQVSDNDRQLIDLVNRRLTLVAQLKRYKESRNIGFVDPEREEWMLSYLQRANPGPLSADGLSELFSEILDLTKREVDPPAAT